MVSKKLKNEIYAMRLAKRIGKRGKFRALTPKGEAFIKRYKNIKIKLR